jgi:GNAT superfamily N-acetyltransferase
MVPIIDVTDDPAEADRAALLAGLKAFNQDAAGVTMRPLAVWLRDGDGGLIGGLTGRSGGGWLFIEYLWLPATQRGRGLGAALVASAEREAVARGCIGVWLDTFSFQAPGFYRRHGYEVFGEIDDYPLGHRRFFMRKRLPVSG